MLLRRSLILIACLTAAALGMGPACALKKPPDAAAIKDDAFPGRVPPAG
jgi:hypothetical protein